MSYEVDFLPVGDESASGDAIALRYGNFTVDPTDQTVVVIDGGFAKNREDLVEHIREFYHTDRVDLVVATHPDQDHVGGLSVVLQELDVDRLAMHLPWNHAPNVAALFQDGRVTSRSVSKRLAESLEQARALEETAREQGVEILEPFAGRNLTPSLLVVGPTVEYYESLLPYLEQNAAPSSRSVPGAIVSSAKKMLRRIHERWDQEVLVEPANDATTPRNNSSAVLLLDLGDIRFLFTADVGVPALEQAVVMLRAFGYDPRAIDYVQIPHHGSKRNVGPAILTEIFGPIVPEGEQTGRHGVISAAANGEPKHPSRRVVNAVIRRGGRVLTTQGKKLALTSDDVPMRPGWGPATPESFTLSYDDEE